MINKTLYKVFCFALANPTMTEKMPITADKIIKINPISLLAPFLLFYRDDLLLIDRVLQ